MSEPQSLPTMAEVAEAIERAMEPYVKAAREAVDALDKGFREFAQRRRAALDESRKVHGGDK